MNGDRVYLGFGFASRVISGIVNILKLTRTFKAAV